MLTWLRYVTTRFCVCIKCFFFFIYIHRTCYGALKDQKSADSWRSHTRRWEQTKKEEKRWWKITEAISLFMECFDSGLFWLCHKDNIYYRFYLFAFNTAIEKIIGSNKSHCLLSVTVICTLVSACRIHGQRLEFPSILGFLSRLNTLENYPNPVWTVYHNYTCIHPKMTIKNTIA